MESSLLSRIQACLAGIKIGDAMGMPWELKTYEEIMAETGGKGIHGFSEPKKRRTDLKLALGESTDDWALTRAIARSLIRRKEFDLYDIAAAQLRELKNELGWGGTTRRAMTEMEMYFWTLGEAGRSPAEPLAMILGDKGAGNGVAIKIAPLVLWTVAKNWGGFSFNYAELWDQVVSVGFQTHPNPLASLAAYAFAVMIVEVFSDPIRGDNQKQEKLFSVRTELARQRNKAKGLNDSIDVLGDRIAIVAENLDNKDALREKIGTGCFAPESVMFSIATFMRHPTDFRAAVLEAASAGGDTDSTASMVGALVGANCGLDAIPEEWRNFRPEFQEPLKLGEKLYFAAQGR